MSGFLSILRAAYRRIRWVLARLRHPVARPISRIDARTYTGAHAARGECPCCENVGGLNWRGVLVPEMWDLVSCDDCGSTVAIDCLVAEEFPVCHGGCRNPGLRITEIPDPDFDEDSGYSPPRHLCGLGEVWTCGDEHCIGEAIKLAREAAHERVELLAGRLY